MGLHQVAYALSFIDQEYHPNCGDTVYISGAGATVMWTGDRWAECSIDQAAKNIHIPIAGLAAAAFIYRHRDGV